MDKEHKNILYFGYGLVFISFLFGVRGVLLHGWQLYQWVFIFCGIVFWFVTVWHVSSLKVVYRGWMRVAHFVGGIIMTGLLGGVYFLLFVPIGLMMRLARRDYLERRKDCCLKTYWKKRSEEVVLKDRYYQQY
ncbi:MAG: hypothetical protein V2A70_08075 [Candidatus Omnitrophota bacterium]